ncbi:DUF5050 domain-containing protein [Oligoflexia bacterium]|nr:DUF5050 domain-containing protein [Oligoflexia bacterium]
MRLFTYLIWFGLYFGYLTPVLAAPLLYWIDYGDNALKRWDGTQITAYDTSTLPLLDSALCEADGYVYFSYFGPSSYYKIQKSKTDFTSVALYSTSSPSVYDAYYGLDALSSGENFFFTDSVIVYSATVNNGALSSSTLLDHADGIRFGRGIELDESGGKIYWIDSGKSLLTETAVNAIKRADLDGTDVETLVSIGSARDLALDLEYNKIYWADNAGTPSIKRSALDGSNTETIVNSGLTYITGIWRKWRARRAFPFLAHHSSHFRNLSGY